jgi:hypothetical protein
VLLVVVALIESSELGEYGLRQYCEVKCVNISLPRHRADIENC